MGEGLCGQESQFLRCESTRRRISRYCAICRKITLPPLVKCRLTCSCLAAGRGSRSCARPGGGGGGGRPLTALLIRCRRCCSQIWFWCACTKNISISEKYLLPPTNLISTSDELLLSFSKFYFSEKDKSTVLSQVKGCENI